MNKPNIILVISMFHETIATSLESSAKKYLKFMINDKYEPKIYHVASEVEIPLACQRIFKKDHPDAIVALGSVIKGETDHYDYVCKMVSQGCMQVSLQANKPIGFGILTTHTKQQALARISEENDKAVETVDTILDFLNKIP